MAVNEIRFLLNDREVVLNAVGPGDTLLDFLRLEARLTGTKEGCAEGDCGACTVLVGRLKKGRLSYDPVNSCIRYLGSLNACHVVTVEYLASGDDGMHPVQRAMVDHHGSQCGFCTPGIVMSLYRLWMENPNPGDRDAEIALQGNLCRCTGYEAIMRAARAMGKIEPGLRDRLARERRSITRTLKSQQADSRITVGRKDNQIVVPHNAADLAQVLGKHRNATIVAGATDVGLWTTKHFRNIAPAVFIGHLDELSEIHKASGALKIGATATYSDASAALVKNFKAFGGLIERIGGAQIRAMGTIGGNIANGSPIGDMPPPLIVLGARLTLRSARRAREIDLEKFFIDYGKQDLRAGEFVESVSVPLLKRGEHFAVYKISKRIEEDITASLLAIRMGLDKSGLVKTVRIACGGMAAIPKRARTVEKLLSGKPWNEAALDAAVGGFEKDFAPITDMRASAAYRMMTVKNLLRRFYLETTAKSDAPVTLAGYRAA